MIKKVKVTDIHLLDAFFGDMNEIVGTILMLDIDNCEYFLGWKSATHNNSLSRYSRFSGREFLGIKFEEVVSEEN